MERDVASSSLPISKQARLLEVAARPPSKRSRSNSTLPESCSYCVHNSDTASSTWPPPSSSPLTATLPPPKHVRALASSNASTSANTVMGTAPNGGPRSDININNNSTTTTTTTIPELPDEVLVAVLRFVPSAATLWGLRAVCRRWRGIIDTQSSVWRDVSFKGLLLTRPVVISPVTITISSTSYIKPNPCKVLTLGPRRGASAVHMAAKAGNPWANFLSTCLFDAVPLKALTVAQPLANRLVTEKCADSAWIFETRERAPVDTNGWVVIHAARRGPQEFARGALVGMMRVSAPCTASGNGWRWKIEEKVKLSLPLRCAGYVGIWSLSRPLTEILIRALHTQ